MDVREAFEASVAAGVRDVASIDGGRAIFPGGTNGPYLDVESPVRNSAHWLATLSIGHHLGLPGARTVGQKLVAFLLSDHPFRYAGRTIHRQQHPKDWCNGVIGEAWVIEALALAGDLLEHDEAAATSIRLAAGQPYACRDHAWERLDPGMRRRGIDQTLNHQLWFAAGAVEAVRAANDSQADAASLVQRVRGMLDHGAHGAFVLGADGSIEHHLRPIGPGRGFSPQGFRRTARAMRDGLDTRRRRARHERDAGYHLYVLSGLARLRTALPEHPIWGRTELGAAIRRASDRAFLASLDTNPYAYPYNAPGFALPLIARTFADLAPELQDRAGEAWEQQVARTWDGRSARFTQGTPDPLTLAARVYELGLALLDQRPPLEATASEERPGT